LITEEKITNLYNALTLFEGGHLASDKSYYNSLVMFSWADLFIRLLRMAVQRTR